MKHYTVTLTALTPLHIGTGKDFEPTHYIIDLNEEKKPRLYEFDEIAFYKALNESQKKEFLEIVSKTNYISRFKLYEFIYKNRDIAKNIAFNTIIVLKEVYKEYKDKIGKVVQKEKERFIFNEFTIAKTYTRPNDHMPVLPGSSLKGAISTAYQETLLKALHRYDEVKKQTLNPNDDNIFRHISITDANPIKQGMSIGYAVNKKRSKETKSDSLKTFLQAISPTSVFKTTIQCKKEVILPELAKSCNDHYFPLFQSQFNMHSDAYIRQLLPDEFIQKYENWKPNNNQFLLRVGKYSGARAVTLEGLREISVKTGQREFNKFAKEETTTWLRSGDEKFLPFGWILCEICDEK